MIRSGERNQDNVNRQTNDRRQHKNVSSHQRAQPFNLIMQHKTQPFKPVPIGTKQPLKKSAKPESTFNIGKPELGEKLENIPSRNFEPIAPLSSSNGQHHREVAVEKDPTIIAHTAIASGRADDINLLIKKLTLNFSAQHNEAQFTMTTGVFEGAHFSLHNDNRNLTLAVSNASPFAEFLLVENQSLLKETLARKEINLCDLTFMS